VVYDQAHKVYFSTFGRVKLDSNNTRNGSGHET
jgi:hypothetical protein